MLASCKVTETAEKLCRRLEAQSIPDDFLPEGEYWEVMLGVRHKFTNYGALRSDLPECPHDCPIAMRAGGPVGAGCFNHDQAHDRLRTAARWLAVRLFDAWQTRQKRAQLPAYTFVNEHSSTVWNAWTAEQG